LWSQFGEMASVCCDVTVRDTNLVLMDRVGEVDACMRTAPGNRTSALCPQRPTCAVVGLALPLLWLLSLNSLLLGS
jgi:hypothetical protein